MKHFLIVLDMQKDFVDGTPDTMRMCRITVQA